MANDFSADSNCISLYRFESGALTTDSKGSQTLSTSAGAPDGSATHMEGSFSTLLGSAFHHYYYRTDANLVSTFPLKSGTSNKTISVCAWGRIVTAPDDPGVRYIMAKWEQDSGDHRTFGARIYKNAGVIVANLVLGDTGGLETEFVTHGSALSTDTWYHFTYGYRDSDKAYRLFIRDTNGNVLGSDVSGTATNNIALFSQSDFMIGDRETGAAPGANDYWDGYLDEVVIFSKLITATDATNIAKGLYSGTGDSGGQTITAAGGSYNQSGTSALFRVGSPLYLRYKK